MFASAPKGRVLLTASSSARLHQLVVVLCPFVPTALILDAPVEFSRAAAAAAVARKLERAAGKVSCCFLSVDGFVSQCNGFFEKSVHI